MTEEGAVLRCFQSFVQSWNFTVRNFSKRKFLERSFTHLQKDEMIFTVSFHRMISFFTKNVCGIFAQSKRLSSSFLFKHGLYTVLRRGGGSEGSITWGPLAIGAHK